MKLTIEDISKCLDLPASTLERWTRQGRIPIKRSDDGYRFQETILRQWAEAHNLTFTPPNSGEAPPKDRKPENLLAAMKRGGVFHGVPGADVASVLGSAAGLIPNLSRNAQEHLQAKLLEREDLASTGIGKGVAIPHPRSPLPELPGVSLVSTCFLEQPIPYDAIDDQPVFVLFILLCPAVKHHLHLLSRLSFCVRDDAFVEFLKSGPDAAGFYSQIERIETGLDGSAK